MSNGAATPTAPEYSARTSDAQGQLELVSAMLWFENHCERSAETVANGAGIEVVTPLMDTATLLHAE